jgi:RNA polymerase sigma factor (sigma-70 family)
MSGNEPMHRERAKVHAQPRPASDAAAAYVSDVYEQHRATIYGFLVSGTRDAELAAELLQETFVRLLKVARTGEVPADPRTWLFRVSGNLAISAARRRETVRKWAPWLARRDTEASPEERYLQREEATKVRAALAQLGPADRVALLMAGQGCSSGEIAAALGRGEVAARSVLCRARTRLRERVEAQEELP